jgi:hypothetical protein
MVVIDELVIEHVVQLIPSELEIIGELDKIGLPAANHLLKEETYSREVTEFNKELFVETQVLLSRLYWIHPWGVVLVPPTIHAGPVKVLVEG